jgi:hypothetical protein
MTKERLENYCNLKQEIAVLDNSILFAENDANGSFDIVNSAAKFPYAKKPSVVMGYGSRALPALLKRRAIKIAECKEIESFVASVEDSIMWQLLTRRYIEGKSLKETADLVGYSQNHAGFLINEFLKVR